MPNRSTPKRRVLLPPDQRRQQLLDAAVTVFAAKGYRRAGVADIIAKAGVARGTFYLYFDSKERLFLTIVEEFHSRVARAFEALDDAAIAAVGAGAAAQAVLRASFRQWLGFFAEHRDVTRVVLREAGAIDARFEQGYHDLRKSAVTRFANRFRKFQQLGLARPTLDPEMAAHFQLGMFDAILHWFVLGEEPADLDRLAAQLADFEWNGIAPSRHE